MDIRKISDSVAIYSDGKKLQVIHNLGDEFILDFHQCKSFNLSFFQECHHFFHFKNLPPYFDTWA